MHLLPKYGMTVDAVKQNYFGKVHCIDGMLEGDNRQEVVESYVKLMVNFDQFWKEQVFDLVFALVIALICLLPYSQQYHLRCL
jgi:hypothetical protein